MFMLLFLATMNFANKYFYFVFLAFFAYLFLNLKFRFTKSACILLLFSIALVCFSAAARISYLAVLKQFTYPICFILGMGICDTTKNPNIGDEESKLNKLILALSGGVLTHYLLNWFNNRGRVLDTRNTVDFWTGEASAATGQALLACMALAVAIAVLTSKNGWVQKALAVLAIAAVLTYNLMLAGRTLLIFGLIILILAILHRLRHDKKGITGFLLGILAVFLIIWLVIQTDFLGIRSFIEDSALYQRLTEMQGEFAQDSRSSRKAEYLAHFFDNLFGGNNLKAQYGYAHDIFLDTYDDAGIITLLLLGIYMIASVRRLVKFVKSPAFSFQTKQIILCTYLILYMSFMAEPILQGLPWLFISFCTIDGGVSSLLKAGNKKTPSLINYPL